MLGLGEENLYDDKHLSVRLIIVQVRWAQEGSRSELVFVCMSVRNRFRIEIYGFTHSLCTFLSCATHGVIDCDGGLGADGGEKMTAG